MQRRAGVPAILVIVANPVGLIIYNILDLWTEAQANEWATTTLCDDGKTVRINFLPEISITLSHDGKVILRSISYVCQIVIAHRAHQHQPRLQQTTNTRSRQNLCSECERTLVWISRTTCRCRSERFTTRIVPGSCLYNLWAK